MKKGIWERVSVTWIDSISIRINGKTWHSYKEIENTMKDKGSYIISTGYRFYEDKDFIVLCTSISFEGNEARLFGDVTAIPKGCIKIISKK